MADTFYSTVLGDQVPADVTKATSTTGETVELRVNDARNSDLLEVIIEVKAILGYLQTLETEPIA